MIYDVMVGETLPTKYAYNYMRATHFDRFQSEEITGYADLVDLIILHLTRYTEVSTETLEIVSDIINEFTSLKRRIENNKADNVDAEIRELLSALAFVGIEFYLIRRPDLKSTAVGESTTRAYMVDKNDSYFPAINRVVNGGAILFDEIRDATISTVVMQFIQDMRFNTIVEDAIKIQDLVDKYHAMDNANMGWALNTDSIIKFLDDYGYKFIVAV